MSKVISLVIIIASLGVVLSLTFCSPDTLAKNQFLSDFINHEILNILAVIMTVTIASVANIHLAFNRTEEMAGKVGIFSDSRKEVNGGALSLIWLFLAVILILVVRSSFLDSNQWLSFFNGLSLLALLVNILVLIDITLSVFALHPYIKENEP